LKSSQPDFVPNGCGGKGGWINPPEWIFHKDCNKHDTAYNTGGDEAARLKADRQFLVDMLASVAKAPWYFRLFFKSQALLYYKAVRMCGAKYFNYRKT
jgi:hypothetical protein